MGGQANVSLMFTQTAAKPTYIATNSKSVRYASLEYVAGLCVDPFKSQPA